MRLIIAIVPVDALDAVRAALVALDVGGVTITRMFGRGTPRFDGDEYWDLQGEGCIRLEMLTTDEGADDLIDAIVGWVQEVSLRPRGMVFQRPVEEVIRIRTHEFGDSAIH